MAPRADAAPKGTSPWWIRGWLPSAGAAVGLALSVTGALPARAQARSEPDLELRFIDVHQGDAILIRLGRSAVLVDAGRGDGIVLELEDLGIDTLVAAIASHNHDDHIGGMDAVLADHVVGRYLYNGRAPENQNAAAVDSILAAKQVRVPRPPWPRLRLGDARITVFPSPLDGPGTTENNSSLGVLVERGAFKALLTGDSERAELNAWIRAGLIPDVDVLKAAHHGSRDGVSPGWLQVTRPEVVVISVGAANPYGHPHPWALRYYAARKRRVYRTDEDGTVIILIDRAGAYRVEVSARVPEQAR